MLTNFLWNVMTKNRIHVEWRTRFCHGQRVSMPQWRTGGFAKLPENDIDGQGDALAVRLMK